MVYLVGTSKNFTVTYTPSGNAPLGLQIVSFQIFNETKTYPYYHNQHKEYTHNSKKSIWVHRERTNIKIFHISHPFFY